MADRPANLTKIAEIDHPCADIALAEALEQADPITAGHLTEILLERGHLQGFLGLIRHYHKLPADAQKLLLDHAGRLDEALRHIGSETPVQPRLNLIDIIHRTSATRLAWLLSQQLHETDSRLSKAAAMALLRLSRRWLVASSGPAGLTPTMLISHRHLLNAVAEACASFHQHRRRDVLLALLCFAPHFPAGLYRYVADPKTATFNPLGELVAQADHPITCRALLGLAAVEPMQPFVIRALSQLAVGPQLSFVLRLSELLLDPMVYATLRKLRRVDHLLVDRAAMNQMDLPTQRRLAWWIEALPTASIASRRISALAGVATSHDRLTRLSALQALMRQPAADQPPANDVIATMCFDAEPAVARLALRHLLRSRWQGLGELMIRLIDSEHEPVRALAEHHLGPVGFEKYWSNWPAMTPATRQVAGRALMKLDPQFLAKMAHRLADDSADTRLQALQIVRQLGLELRFESQLLSLADDPDTRIAAAAVRLMAALHHSPRAVAAVSNALTHHDDRVRANAVESLEVMQRVGQMRDTLMDLSAGRGNRSRANAIKALMSLPVNEAIPALLNMLHDEDDRHRISALWVVERMNLMPLVEQVADLARGDHDLKVRRRAVRVVQDLAKVAMNDRKQAG